MRYVSLGFFIVGASLVLFTPQIWKQRAIQHSIDLLEQLQIQVGPELSCFEGTTWGN